MMELYNSFFVKAHFDMTSKNALDVSKNAKSTAKYFEELHKVIEKCDSFRWDGEDSQWIHAFVKTKDKKLQKSLMDKYGFEDYKEVWGDD